MIHPPRKTNEQKLDTRCLIFLCCLCKFLFSSLVYSTHPMTLNSFSIFITYFHNLMKLWIGMSLFHRKSIRKKNEGQPTWRERLLCKHTATSLLHTTEWLIESHIVTNWSWPAVRNCGKLGWMARPHNSSVWPQTTGVRPKSKLPINMQFFVVPTSSCEPRPSAMTRTGPVKIIFGMHKIYLKKLERNFIQYLKELSVNALHS